MWFKDLIAKSKSGYQSVTSLLFIDEAFLLSNWKTPLHYTTDISQGRTGVLKALSQIRQCKRVAFVSEHTVPIVHPSQSDSVIKVSTSMFKAEIE